MESTTGALILRVSDRLESLTDLPHELLLQILDELDNAALCALGSTCKDFNNLIFPLFFDKHKITNPSQGWISCYRAPEHTLRAIRCSLSTKNIRNIYYFFNKGIDRLVEEIGEMHAIVRRTDQVTNFNVYLADLDDWATRDARELDETRILRLTSEEWTKLYVGLLTASLTKGCKHVQLSGGSPFWGYLRDRDRRQIMRAESLPIGSALSLKERVLGSKPTRYFDDTFHYESPLADKSEPCPMAQSVEKLPLENTVVAEVTTPQVPEGNSASNLPTPQTVRDMKTRHWHRLTKWTEFLSKKKNKNSSQVEVTISSTAAHSPKGFKTVSPGSNLTRLSDLNKPSTHAKAPKPARTMGRPTTPKIESLILQSDMFFASPSFLDWTNQLLSWCAPTLTHFELQCPETPSGTWCKFFSEVTLPSLTCLEITCNLVIGAANIQGSDILGFLGRHPSIRKLYLHGIQVPASLCGLPKAGEPILPNLVEVTAHPMYIRWLLHDKKQCPKLKEVVLLTEYYASLNPPFAYDVLDKALEDLLPRSHKLDVIGFKFTNDHHDLDSWLQLHVDAGPNASILSSFINTKHLQINAGHYVKIINYGYRLELVAQFIGLFPNLDYLELKDQPGAPYNKTNHIPPVVEALRLHSPQVKKVKINIQNPIDVAGFEPLEKE